MGFNNFAIRSQLCSVTIPNCKGGAGGLRLFSVRDISRSVIKRAVSFSGRTVTGGLALFLCPSSSSRDNHLLQICRRCFVMYGTMDLVLGRTRRGNYGLRSLTSCTMVRVGSARPSVMVPRLVHHLVRGNLLVSRTVSVASGIYTCAGRAVLTRTLRG